MQQGGIVRRRRPAGPERWGGAAFELGTGFGQGGAGSILKHEVGHFQAAWRSGCVGTCAEHFFCKSDFFETTKRTQAKSSPNRTRFLRRDFWTQKSRVLAAHAAYCRRRRRRPTRAEPSRSIDRSRRWFLNEVPWTGGLLSCCILHLHVGNNFSGVVSKTTNVQKTKESSEPRQTNLAMRACARAGKLCAWPCGMTRDFAMGFKQASRRRWHWGSPASVDAIHQSLS